VVSVFSIRPGVAADAPVVSAFALRSKGHWGYSPEFLEACRDELTYTEADCSSGDLYVATADGNIAGFYLLHGVGPEAELAALFVDPPRIGQGLGGVLLRHALDLARTRGVVRVHLDADPDAAPFYVHHGARRVGEAPSGSIPGRVLPLLEFELRRAGPR
jgi:GNAT superfamily N-acetyltransferase